MSQTVTLPPVLRDNYVYPDMADNLSKVYFKVRVKESYVPHIHYAFMQDGAPPPVRQMDDIMDDVCIAGYPLTYIIDALCGGHWLEFENLADMDVAKEWLARYLKDYEGKDLTNYPDRIAFNKNVERTLGMLNGNIRRRDEHNQNKHPDKVDILDLLSLM